MSNKLCAEKDIIKLKKFQGYISYNVKEPLLSMNVAKKDHQFYY